MTDVSDRKVTVLKALAAAIRRRRQALRLTQEDVAFKAGMSVRHYQTLESGKLNPSFLVLRSVANALAIGISPLIIDAGPQRSAKPQPPHRRRPE